MLKLVIKKIENGVAECEYHYDKEFEKLYAKETGATIVHKANVGKFIVRSLTKAFGPTPKKTE